MTVCVSVAAENDVMRPSPGVDVVVDADIVLSSCPTDGLLLLVVLGDIVEETADDEDVVLPFPGADVLLLLV